MMPELVNHIPMSPRLRRSAFNLTGTRRSNAARSFELSAVPLGLPAKGERGVPRAVDGE